MHGVLIVDKPAGPTSHDVVAVARRAIGIDRIGHTGTLDPLATGVLPLVVGRATRLASFLSGAEKEYVARIRFGTSTATYDAEGETFGQEALELAPMPGPVAESAVRDVLPDFAGTYWQLPPPFSAKKIGGTPAYKLARLRKPVELKPVQVTVKAIDLRAFADNLAEIRIVCSSGFYVRSLAHDLGQRLECGAYLEGLQRTRAGSFGLADATPLDVLIGEGRAAIAAVDPGGPAAARTAGDRAERARREAGEPRQFARSARSARRAQGDGVAGRRPERRPPAARWTPRERSSGSRSRSKAGFCIPSLFWCKILSRLEL